MQWAGHSSGTGVGGEGCVSPEVPRRRESFPNESPPKDKEPKKRCYFTALMWGKAQGWCYQNQGSQGMLVRTVSTAGWREMGAPLGKSLAASKIIPIPA